MQLKNERKHHSGFLPIVNGNTTFIADQSNSDMLQNSSDLYNGNIARMVTTITDPNSRAVLPLGNAYRYDQLNRLKHAVSFDQLNGNAWTGGAPAKYGNSFTYDANGNILTQTRNDDNNQVIDELAYFYPKNAANKTVRNRLLYVSDNVDYDALDIDPGMATSNYNYDQEGRLIQDLQEEIASIEWRVDGKVKRINRIANSTKQNLSFEYDAMGHRIAKHVYTSANVLEKSTYYVLDATGNTMATYERAVDENTLQISYAQTEKFIYGSSRLGVQNCSTNLLGSAGTTTYVQTTVPHRIGQKGYELSNHLGNVLSVISDKAIPHNNGGGVIDYFLADIRQAQDYSPFGVLLQNRNLSLSGAIPYRYLYQRQEMDDEVKSEGNSVNYKYRMHDPRLGRFFAVDPLARDYPYNSTYAFSENDVIGSRELEGLEKVKLFTTSFAPFDTFGGVFSGDGDNRKFGDQFTQAGQGGVIANSNFKIAGSVYIDLATGASSSKGYGAFSHQSLDLTSGEETCFSDGTFDCKVNSSGPNEWNGKMHNYGNNCAVAMSCPIDVYSSVTLKYDASCRWLYIAGNSCGDKFPANEQYIVDQYGTKVMCGVSGVDSKYKEAAPFTELCGNATNEDMSDYAFHIILDETNKFVSVRFNQVTYTIDEWNQKFTGLTPTNPKVNTSVSTTTGTFITTQ